MIKIVNENCFNCDTPDQTSLNIVQYYDEDEDGDANYLIEYFCPTCLRLPNVKEYSAIRNCNDERL